ncbi:biotin transport system permease protein [Haloarchaeobius iranensis]|uniref:Biotin transport system permease protein n=2 Tax=Haloarchaeobius iranensis TaxID=996166 RepID=A0A1G9XLT2_9EURY|nr:energy-coupling factor transporter transmembrane component T [Haloarchaeobius iranensis]SDM97461.1 biotin transport system permease protein [Haloarchaeobius iranensis]
MISYTPGGTLAHRLDARSKLLFQFGFAIAAFATPTPRWLAAVAVVAALALVGSRTSPVAVVRTYWFVFVLLFSGPAIDLVALSPLRLTPGPAVAPTLAVSRVGLVLFVGAAYVRTTPVRETRATIQRYVPGNAGRLLGVGVALTARFLPVLRRDLTAARTAMRARLGGERPVTDRLGRLGRLGLVRAFERADRLALALRTRCFSWEPTPPRFRFTAADAVVSLLGGGLAVAGLSVVLGLRP